MNRLPEWFTENELLLNLKPGKTELLVFGTNQRLAKIPKNIYNRQVIIATTLYKYLGVELKNSLNLNRRVDRNCKKVSSRVKTLHCLKHLLTNKSAKVVSSLMVLRTLSVRCSLLKPSFSNTHAKKLRS